MLTSSMVAKEFPDSTAITFALLETFFRLGLISGPVVGGWLNEFGGFSLPFALLGGKSSSVCSLWIYCTVKATEQVIWKKNEWTTHRKKIAANVIKVKPRTSELYHWNCASSGQVGIFDSDPQEVYHSPFWLTISVLHHLQLHWGYIYKKSLRNGLTSLLGRRRRRRASWLACLPAIPSLFSPETHSHLRG